MSLHLFMAVHRPPKLTCARFFFTGVLASLIFFFLLDTFLPSYFFSTTHA